MAVVIKPKATPAPLSEPLEKSSGVTPAPVSRGKPKAKPRVSRTPKKKRGRPIKYGWDIYQRIFEEVAKGRAVESVLADDPKYMDARTFYRALKADPELKTEFEHAEAVRFNRLAYESIALIDDVQEGDKILTKNGKTLSSFARDRLAKAIAQAKARQWLLSRLEPRFRDAQKITHDGSVSAILVTGGLPDQPLGELATEEEKDRAIAEAQRPRRMTKEEINNPFGLDVAAREREIEEEQAAERERFGQSPPDYSNI